MRKNRLIDTDSYKHSHYLQYPPEAKFISSYVEPRYSKEYNEVLFFGLQMWLLDNFSEPLNKKEVDEAEEICRAHGEPFNREGFDHILKEYKGWMPLSIQAIKEGLVVPLGTPLTQVRNTDPKCAFLTSFIETSHLRAVWYPTTVASKSLKFKKTIKKHLDKTCDDPDSILPFRLHDFGFRGVSSYESGCIGGLAHLVNFLGTDTMGALLYGRAFYNEHMSGNSIPASEHSTMTSWGPKREVDAYANMVDKLKYNGILACVSDSYNIYHAVEKIWGETLKQKVIDSKAIVVIRPDSGDPLEVCVKLVQILADKFGFTVNRKGYKVLNNVRLIQGDGVCLTVVDNILTAFEKMGFSAENIAFGMGGELLQKVNRDDLGFAMKANAIDYGYGWEPVYKKPATDPQKASKAGRQAVVFSTGIGNGRYTAIHEEMLGNRQNFLETVWENGKLHRFQTLKEIRANSLS